VVDVAFAVSVTSPMVSGSSERSANTADVEIFLEEDFERWRRGANDRDIRFYNGPGPGVVCYPSDIIRLKEYGVDIQTTDDTGNTETAKD
jgi:hypothetical protein